MKIKKRILAGFMSVIMAFGMAVTAYADEIPEGTQMDSVSEEEPETDIGSIDISADEMKNTEENTEKTEKEDTKDREEETEEPQLFNIHISEIENGTVLVNGMGTDQVSEAGETINVSVIPDEDYMIDTVSVVDTSKAQINIAGSDGNYSLTMPKSDVEISASLREKEVKAVASDETVTKPQTKAARAFGGNVSVVNYGYASMGRLGTANDAILTIDGNHAYCVNPEMHAPDTGTYTPAFYSSTNDPTLVNVLYYGYYGAGDITGNYGLSTDERHALTHMAAAKAFGGNWTYGLNSVGIGVVNQFMADVAAKPQVSGTVMIFQQYVGGQNVAQLVSATVPEGTVKLKKSSAVPEITDNNSCYSLADAVYGVYSDAGCTNKAGEFRTDASGNTGDITLNPGTYYVKELTAPKGYLQDKTVYSVNVTAGKTATVSVQDMPGNDPISVILQKLDAETGKASEKLAGAEYTVKYYDVASEAEIGSATPKSTWILKTDKRGFITLEDSYKVSGDEFFVSDKGNAVLPIGYITIQETKAPTGYVLDSKIYVCCTEENNGVIRTTNLPTGDNAIKEKYARGDLALTKISDNKKVMAGVSFKITSVETNESAVIVTDANGYASTASSHNPHSQKTNQGTDAACGVWFRNDVAVNDAVGALPLGTYIVEELRSKANYGHMLMAPLTVEVTEHGKTVELGNLENKTIKLGTTALSSSTGTQVVPVSDSEDVVDSIAYENLNVGKTYTFKGTLIDKESGNVVATGETSVKAGKSNGTVDVVFNLSTKELAGKTLVVFEELYDESGKLSEHKDKNDEKQTVYVPKIGTTAIDANTNDHVGMIGKTQLIDTVSYKNLVVGKEYTVGGVLMNKATGNPLLVDGKEIKGETTFTAEAADGTVDVVFELDSSLLSGTTVVAFETLSHNGIEVEHHADIEDSAQSVYYPGIHTTATIGGAKTITAGGMITLTDTIHYTNLIPGTTYTAKGVLMDKTTGKELLVNGQRVTAETTFTPDAADGDVDVTFTLDSSNLGGKDLVVFEELEFNGVTVVEHKDITDKEQTVTVKKVGQVKVRGGSNRKSPNTGDSTDTTVFMGTLLAAAIGLTLVIRKMRKDNKR